MLSFPYHFPIQHDQKMFEEMQDHHAFQATTAPEMNPFATVFFHVILLQPQTWTRLPEIDRVLTHLCKRQVLEVNLNMRKAKKRGIWGHNDKDVRRKANLSIG